MTARPEWVRMEAAIVQSLSSSGARLARTQLLASLLNYSEAATREARVLGPIHPTTADRGLGLEWLRRPVFICGHQRSGTTLLQNLLDAHPQLLVLPNEGTYFSSFAYVARRRPSNQDLDRFAAEWIRRFVDPNYEPHFRLGFSDQSRNPSVEFARALFGWCEALKPCVPARLAPLLALIAAYWTTAARSSTPLCWVEKTPRNEHRLAELAYFKDARFIQLVRDPFATLTSLREIYGTSNVPFNAAQAARAIGHSLRRAHENQHRLGHRYLIVRYEDLVDCPSQQMERVRCFLGVDPSPTLLVPTAGGHAVRANSSFGLGTAGVIERPRMSAVLPVACTAMLAAYTADAASDFGYEVPAPRPIARYAILTRHLPGQIWQIACSYLRHIRSRFA